MSLSANTYNALKVIKTVNAIDFNFNIRAILFPKLDLAYYFTYL
jgi:hypothetical protein